MSERAGDERLVAGRYRLSEKLGSGGMGSVWRAFDERLRRTVAVKQVHVPSTLSGSQSDELVRRTMREGRIAARLHHTQLITVYDVVEDGGQPYLIMEHFPSTSLAALGTLSFAEVARIGAQAAAALAAAHESGVVHRDIKPANILVSADRTVKITDFGISRVVEDLTATMTGRFAGTPAYLAPEVAKGGQATFASDVYALGATLYATVEGTPPSGENTNPMGLLYRVASGQVRPPKQAGPLTATLMWLLNTEPAGRPTMTQASVALAEVPGAEPSRPGRAIGAAGLASALGAAGLAGSGSSANSAGPAPSSAAGSTGPADAADTAATSTDPAGSTGPADSTGSADSASPTGSTGPTDSAGPNDSAESADSTSAAASIDTANPDDSAAPAALTSQADSTSADPADTTDTADSADSADSPTSADSTGPTASAGSAAGAVPAPPPGESAAASAPGATPPAGKRRLRAALLAAGLLVVAATAALVTLLLDTNNPPANAADRQAADSPATTSPTTTPEPTTTTPSTEPTTTTATPPPEQPGTPQQPPAPATPVDAILDYYGLMPANRDTAWPRLTPGFQENQARGRDGYERFWGGITSVEASGATQTGENTVEVSLLYTFTDGHRERERHSYTLVNQNGTWLIDTQRTVSRGPA